MLFYRPKHLVDHFRNCPKYLNRNVFISKDTKVPEKFISICTTCMNRLRDLEYTLPKNLEDNKNYKKLEFVLLDYNSTDGLSDWVKKYMMSYIKTGRLVY